MITTELKIYLCDWGDSEPIHVVKASFKDPLPVATHLELHGEDFYIETDKSELKLTSSGWYTTLYAYKVCDEVAALRLKNILVSDGFKVVS